MAHNKFLTFGIARAYTLTIDYSKYGANMLQATSNVDPIQDARIDNVVPLKRGPQPYSYQKRLPDADAAMSVLRKEMQKHHAANLADRVGVSDSCIYAIQSGRTKWPRPATFFNLIEELQLDLYLVPRKP